MSLLKHHCWNLRTKKCLSFLFIFYCKWKWKGFNEFGRPYWTTYQRFNYFLLAQILYHRFKVQETPKKLVFFYIGIICKLIRYRSVENTFPLLNMERLCIFASHSNKFEIYLRILLHLNLQANAAISNLQFGFLFFTKLGVNFKKDIMDLKGLFSNFM